MRLPEHWTFFEEHLSWDYWYIIEDGVCHAFFLQYERDKDRAHMHSRQTIGHAVSRDFKAFEYLGTVLEADKDTWNDLGVATGSVVRHEQRYYMLYTGKGISQHGVGLAVSDDLHHWQRYGDGPVLTTMLDERCVDYHFEQNGETQNVQLLADPYVYPELIDGHYYCIINSWMKDLPKNDRGCQAMFKSKDLIHWEPHKIALHTPGIDRTETAQFWEKNGKWYLSFGGVVIKPDEGDFAAASMATFIYMADCFDGPYLPQTWSKLNIKVGGDYYLFKAMDIPGQGDALLVLNGNAEGNFGPYRLEYGADGEIKIGGLIR